MSRTCTTCTSSARATRQVWPKRCARLSIARTPFELRRDRYRPDSPAQGELPPMNGPGQWVLLAYQLPREPSAPRVSAWRKLRRLGVAQLMDGFVALPMSERNRERLEWLAEEIREANGEAAIWLARPGSLEQERSLVSGLQDAVAEEYRQGGEA